MNARDLFLIAISFFCGVATYAIADEWKSWEAKWKSRREQQLSNTEEE